MQQEQLHMISNNLYNLTSSLMTSINFHQLILHIRSVFTNLHDSLNYLRTVSTHTMDCIDAATSGTLSPHILPVMDLQRMLTHIADTLPPTLHLPVSPDDALHFYRHLCTHIWIENKQFLLLIDMPIQDRSWQITIHEILTLSIPHGNYSAHYDIDTKYLGITKDATMAVELATTQFRVCQEVNGQFCSITTPFQPLANPTSCIAALYVKSTVDITSKCSLQIWKASDTKCAYPDSTRFLDSYNTTCSSSKHHDIDMPWESHGDHHNTKTSTHTEATYGLQCHLIKLLPTT